MLIDYRSEFSNNELKSLFELSDIFSRLNIIINILCYQDDMKYSKEFLYHTDILIKSLNNAPEYLLTNKFEVTIKK